MNEQRPNQNSLSFRQEKSHSASTVPIATRQLNGFTLVELLVVMALIAILAALLMSALAGTKLRSQQITCINNVRQLTVSSMLYSDDLNVWVGPMNSNPDISQGDWI